MEIKRLSGSITDQVSAFDKVKRRFFTAGDAEESGYGD